MHRTPRLLLAFLFGTSVAMVRPAAQTATVKPAAVRSADIPFRDAEFSVEEQLLVLANQARHNAGAPPLKLDSGLSQAARIHAQAMLEANQLSHQFSGEATLPQRLAATSDLLLDQEGENVALDYDAEHGHEHLMHSPPHRANLLNPAYNTVGLGVVRSGDRLFIVQDFAHALPSYSDVEVKSRIAATVSQMRHSAGQTELARHDLQSADAAACSMAQADKLGTATVQKLARDYTVLTYTSLQPEILPAGATHAIASHNLKNFSIGACYSRTETYPTGVYWVVLTLE